MTLCRVKLCRVAFCGVPDITPPESVLVDFFLPKITEESGSKSTMYDDNHDAEKISSLHCDNNESFRRFDKNCVPLVYGDQVYLTAVDGENV